MCCGLEKFWHNGIKLNTIVFYDTFQIQNKEDNEVEYPCLSLIAFWSWRCCTFLFLKIPSVRKCLFSTFPSEEQNWLDKEKKTAKMKIKTYQLLQKCFLRYFVAVTVDIEVLLSSCIAVTWIFQFLDQLSFYLSVTYCRVAHFQNN